MTLKDRIREAMDGADSGAGISPAELSRRTKRTKGAITQWLGGETKSLKAETASLIEHATGYSSNWIATGKGPKKVDQNTSQPVKLNVVEMNSIGRGKNRPDELVIPQFNTGGSMGRGLLLRDQPGVIQGWSVNQEWVNKNVKSHTGAQNLCIVTGFGDSMKGMFNPGDPLLVDSGVKSVDFDAVYFFRVGEEGFVKRLQRIPGEGLRVLSENQKYESWTVKSDMDFEVFGRVLKAWQGEDF